MYNKGSIITLVLVFGMIFLILLGGLFGFILLQLRQSAQKLAWSQAIHITEAGINYYRWCLNNDAEDVCFAEKEYFDPEGRSIGAFSLETSSATSCGETIAREIFSIGWTNKFPEIKRKISVLYARTSVAEYAYLLNDNVWAGADREIRGLYHSNGGIRMDGENQSLVTSSLEEWLCTSSFGCSPSSIQPGVFTTSGNANEDLFEFPVPPFDFDGITIDLAQIKSNAQLSSVYLPPVVDIDPQGDGYHLIFKNNGTVDVWLITRLWSDWAYSLEQGWHYDYFRIRDEYFYNNYSIGSDCSVIFIEDNLWIEGEVKGKVTVASANLIEPNEDTDVILLEDIDYTAQDGSDGLAVIGERNILIGPDSPDQMEIRGIFVAQKGRFGRNHYVGNIREKLEITGSIVSNDRVGTKWTSGSVIVSGYLKRENYIDSKLIYNPPPFTPYAEYDFKIVRWEEVE